MSKTLMVCDRLEIEMLFFLKHKTSCELLCLLCTCLNLLQSCCQLMSAWMSESQLWKRMVETLAMVRKYTVSLLNLPFVLEIATEVNCFQFVLTGSVAFHSVLASYSSITFVNPVPFNEELVDDGNGWVDEEMQKKMCVWSHRYLLIVGSNSINSLPKAR